MSDINNENSNLLICNSFQHYGSLIPYMRISFKSNNTNINFIYKSTPQNEKELYQLHSGIPAPIHSATSGSEQDNCAELLHTDKCFGIGSAEYTTSAEEDEEILGNLEVSQNLGAETTGLSKSVKTYV